MKKKLESDSPSNAAACSPSSTPEMDAAAYEATTRTVGKWIVPLAKAQNMERARNDALRELLAAGREIIEAARRSLPRPHPTIERNAKLFIPDNAIAMAPPPQRLPSTNDVPGG